MKTFIICDNSTNITQQMILASMASQLGSCVTVCNPVDEFTVTLTDKSLELIRNVDILTYSVSSSKVEEKQPNYNRKNKWQSPNKFHK